MRVRVLALVALVKCISICVVNSYNILGVFPFLGKSHFYVYRVYLQELAKRGHNVTVMSFFPQDPTLKNYHDIDLGKDNKYFEFRHPITVSSFHKLLSLTILQSFMAPYTCRLILEDDEVQGLLKSQQKFDLVVMEQFTFDCPLSIAYKLNAPVIGMTSGLLLPWHYDRYGVPYNPSYVLYDIFNGINKPTLMDRIIRTVSYYYIRMVHRFSYKSEDRVISDFFDDVPPIEELSRKIKFILLYQNFVVSGTQILPSNVIEVGGFHVAKPKRLPPDLEKFIEESENGVIYISFGTILNGASMPRRAFNAIIGALKELPHRVLWKWEKEIPNKPDHVYVSKWMPQNDILGLYVACLKVSKRLLLINQYLLIEIIDKNILIVEGTITRLITHLPNTTTAILYASQVIFSTWALSTHPKVVAFFSHCGQLGTTEAVHHGVPIIGMPITADQFSNAAAIEERGLGVQVDLNTMTKELLLEKFRIILNPRFKSHVESISEMWHDRPVSALDTAIHWTEFAARYPNYTYTSPITNITTYQYLCLDVMFIIVALILTIVYLIKFSFTFWKNTSKSRNALKIKTS